MPSRFATDPYLRRLAILIAAFALSLVLFPLLALAPTVVALRWPSWVGNGLFFWPQYLLLPSGIQSTATSVVYGADAAPFIAAAFWLAILVGVARLTLAWRKRWALPALFATVVVIAEIALVGLSFAELAPVLDGL